MKGLTIHLFVNAMERVEIKVLGLPAWGVGKSWRFGGYILGKMECGEGRDFSGI